MVEVELAVFLVPGKMIAQEDGCGYNNEGNDQGQATPSHLFSPAAVVARTRGEVPSWLWFHEPFGEIERRFALRIGFAAARPSSLPLTAEA